MSALASRTLLTRSLRERTPGALKASAALAFYAVVGSWMYSSFSDDLDDLVVDLPDALSAMMGGNLLDTPGGYITAAMVNLLAPLVFVGLAIAWGSALVAGDEHAGTARLLFAQPISRRHVTIVRAIGLVIDLAVGIGLFLAGLAAAGAIFGDGPAVSDLLATGVHLWAFAAAIGMLALAASNTTGSRRTGITVGAGITLASYLIDSFVPLTAAEGLEHWTPWYLYNGHEPISTGLDPVSLLLLAAISLGGAGVAAWVVDRRDLEPSSPGLLTRLPGIGALATPRVSSIFARTTSDRLPTVVGLVIGLGLFMIAMGAMYPSVEESLADVTDDLPAALTNLIGGTDIATPVGWLNAEAMSIIVPFAVLAVAIGMGANLVAGERERGTLALMMSTHLTRSRYLAQQCAALASVVIVVSAGVGLSLLASSMVADLGIGADGLVVASAQLAALGLFFGAVTIAIGTVLTAATARATSAGIAVAAFLAQGVLTSVDGLEGLRYLTPWHYYIGNTPLAGGGGVGYTLILLGGAALAAAGAFALVRRTELA